VTETFGVKVIQEIIAALPGILGNNRPKRQQDDPLKLVLAIKAAREAGMEELAIDLEERLTGFAHPTRAPEATAPEAVPTEDSDPNAALRKAQAQETRPMSPDTIRKLQEVHFPKLDRLPGDPTIPLVADVPVHIGGGGTIHMEDPLGRRPSSAGAIEPYGLGESPYVAAGFTSPHEIEQSGEASSRTVFVSTNPKEQ
jgi:hypothetical protein